MKTPPIRRSKLLRSAAERAREQTQSRSREFWIGICVALVTVLLSVGGSLYVASRSAQDAQHQAKESFLREQRRIAYTDFLNAEAQMRFTEINVFLIYKAVNQPQEAINEAVTRRNDAWSELTQMYSGVLILGSDATWRSASDVLEAHDSIGNDVVGWQDGVSAAEDTQWSTTYYDTIALVSTFVGYAARDIEAN